MAVGGQRRRTKTERARVRSAVGRRCAPRTRSRRGRGGCRGRARRGRGSAPGSGLRFRGSCFRRRRRGRWFRCGGGELRRRARRFRRGRTDGTRFGARRVARIIGEGCGRLRKRRRYGDEVHQRARTEQAPQHARNGSCSAPSSQLMVGKSEGLRFRTTRSVRACREPDESLCRFQRVLRRSLQFRGAHPPRLLPPHARRCC